MLDMPILTFPLYKALGFILTPMLPIYLKKRIARGKEDKDRLHERFGLSQIQRPDGTLIWLHAASVGELISTFALLKQLEKNHPTISILITTGTVTSARMAKKHLSAKIIHQFAPLDSPIYVKNFLNHWKPDLVLWLESEFWPNQLLSLQAKHIPTLLLNARMSDSSFAKWSKHPRSVKALLNCFSGLSAQSPKDREKLHILADGKEIFLPGNLKQAAARLPFGHGELDNLKSNINNRCIIVAASTHKGDETLLLQCYKRLASFHSSTPPLLIIVPRHPERGSAVIKEIKDANLSYAQRSEENHISAETHVYLADTLGELGLFYALADIVFIGGTLGPKIGGHNPVEAAMLDCAILYGADMANFASISKALEECNAAIPCSDSDAITKNIDELLSDVAARKRLASNALLWAESQTTGILKRVESLILKYLPKSDIDVKDK